MSYSLRNVYSATRAVDREYERFKVGDDTLVDTDMDKPCPIAVWNRAFAGVAGLFHALWEYVPASSSYELTIHSGRYLFYLTLKTSCNGIFWVSQYLLNYKVLNAQYKKSVYLITSLKLGVFMGTWMIVYFIISYFL